MDNLNFKLLVYLRVFNKNRAISFTANVYFVNQTYDRGYINTT